MDYQIRHLGNPSGLQEILPKIDPCIDNNLSQHMVISDVYGGRCMQMHAKIRGFGKLITIPKQIGQSSPKTHSSLSKRFLEARHWHRQNTQMTNNFFF